MATRPSKREIFQIWARPTTQYISPRKLLRTYRCALFPPTISVGETTTTQPTHHVFDDAPEGVLVRSVQAHGHARTRTPPNMPNRKASTFPRGLGGWGKFDGRLLEPKWRQGQASVGHISLILVPPNHPVAFPPEIVMYTPLHSVLPDTKLNFVTMLPTCATTTQRHMVNWGMHSE